MNEKRLALAVFLSIPSTIILFYLLAFIWPLIFPYASAYMKYASPFASPVHVAFPISTAILFYVFLEWLEREKLGNPRSFVTFLALVVVIFLAYYIGVAGFYFYRFLDFNVVNVIFTYFLYVPYWTALGGLLGAWIAYVLPLPKPFKEKPSSS